MDKKTALTEKEFYVYGKVHKKIEAIKIKGFTDGKYNYYQVSSGSWVTQIPQTGEPFSVSDTLEEAVAAANNSERSNAPLSEDAVRRFREDIRKAEMRRPRVATLRGT